MAAAAVCMTACTSDPVAPADAPVVPPPTEDAVEAEQPTLSTATLSSFAASQNRVVAAPQTRADAQSNPITEIVTLENLSKENAVGGIDFTKEDRYLSATCVYFDPATQTYYVTYHMQGNNYKTQQDVETLGYIESFKIQDGTIVPGTVYYSSNPAFDFNHLYFDNLGNTNWGGYSGTDSGSRIIAVGHKSEPSSKEGGEPNTAAIIANLDLNLGMIEYSKVLTGDKLRDAAGRSLGDVDAGDVNCVIRKYDWYYLATRKGIAVLNAKEDKLFTPIQAKDKDVYFIKTPGSAKHFSHMLGSAFSLLYLTQPAPEGYDGSTTSTANVILFSMEDYLSPYAGSLTGMGTADKAGAIENVADFDITTWSTASNGNQFTIPDLVYPIDGKNVVATPSSGRVYACLGKAGLYVRLTGSRMNAAGTASEPFVDEKTIKFSDATDGSRPVNGVFVEEYGYIYVANGVCLTVLDYNTLEVVADFTLGKDAVASANYVHVEKNAETNERTITVAYGQAGVKVLRFVPPTR